MRQKNSFTFLTVLTKKVWKSVPWSFFCIIDNVDFFGMTRKKYQERVFIITVNTLHFIFHSSWDFLINALVTKLTLEIEDLTDSGFCKNVVPLFLVINLQNRCYATTMTPVPLILVQFGLFWRKFGRRIHKPQIQEYVILQNLNGACPKQFGGERRRDRIKQILVTILLSTR